MGLRVSVHWYTIIHCWYVFIMGNERFLLISRYSCIFPSGVRRILTRCSPSARGSSTGPCDAMCPYSNVTCAFLYVCMLIVISKAYTALASNILVSDPTGTLNCFFLAAPSRVSETKEVVT